MPNHLQRPQNACYTAELKKIHIQNNRPCNRQSEAFLFCMRQSVYLISRVQFCAASCKQQVPCCVRGRARVARPRLGTLPRCVAAAAAAARAGRLEAATTTTTWCEVRCCGWGVLSTIQPPATAGDSLAFFTPATSVVCLPEAGCCKP